MLSENQIKADMTMPLSGGFVNVRVGAIIMKDGRVLMAGNDASDYLYSVGGRVKFGETAEDAIIREVYEETGVMLEVDRLGFVHENYFVGDSIDKMGKVVYEISFYFYMKTPEDFEPVSKSFTEGGHKEFLKWISPNTDEKYFPEFFRDELKAPVFSVKHIVTDER